MNPEPRTQPSAHEIIDFLTKLSGILIVLLYLVGFLVVAINLSHYGVSSFSALRLQYLIAGIWAVGPLAFLILVRQTQLTFEERVAPRTWLRRFVLSVSVTGIPYAACTALLAFAAGRDLSEMSLWDWVHLNLFYLVATVLVFLFWRSWRVEQNKETKWINRTHAAPYYLVALFVILLCCTVWFSFRIYPLIPFSFGGGRPLTVVFIAGETPLPKCIVNDKGRSIPYKLLMETDNSYVVLSSEPNEESIEIARDAVQSMVVLKDK